jgi:hypothetical protein
MRIHREWNTLQDERKAEEKNVGQRRVRKMADLQKEEQAKNLIKEEILALQLYTGVKITYAYAIKLNVIPTWFRFVCMYSQ